MANVIILSWTSPIPEYLKHKVSLGTDGDKILNALKNVKRAKIPLLDDITLDINTNYESASSVFSILGSAASLLSKMGSATGRVTNLQRMLDLQVWKSTEPMKISFDALFTTNTNPIVDVLAPVLGLMNLATLTATEGGSFIAPGVNLSNLKEFLSDSDKKYSTGKKTGVPQKSVALRTEGAKILSIKIPGIIELPKCMVRSIKPTFSKQVTESGIPLWCRLSMTVESIWPTADSDFEIMVTDLLSLKKSVTGG